IEINDEILVADFSSLTYSPATGVSGNNYAKIGFQASDGIRYDIISKSSIIINITNNAPTTDNIEVTAPKNSSYAFKSTDFTDAASGDYKDQDGDAFAGIQIAALPDSGTLYNDADGDNIIDSGENINVGDTILSADVTKLKYTPTTGESGGTENDTTDNYDFFTFKVYDGDAIPTNAYSTPATAYIDVLNAPPTADNFTVTAPKNSSYAFTANNFENNISGNYADTNGDAFAGIQITSLPAKGTLYYDTDGDKNGENGEEATANTLISPSNIGKLIFTPTAGESGTP
ncbi:MAG: hypothetical protein JRJ44_09440, partial [Deltaproteobacteria bacterium]|nr:hypothetical protein [Deltaproteobacteria bacterium]